MNRLAGQLTADKLDAAIWEGVRAVFESRHGEGSCPDARLLDLMEANRIGGAWSECVIAAKAALSALEAQGLKIVPVEPTEAMVNASISVYNGAGQAEPAEVYAAMLNAVEG